MKSESGITLASVLIYVIVMLMAVAIVSVISTYFHKNVQGYTTKTDEFSEYTKFNSYFTEEINISNNKILECNESYIVFSSNNQYTYLNNSVYQNNVKIAKDVQSCSFEQIRVNGKEAVKVRIKIRKSR